MMKKLNCISLLAIVLLVAMASSCSSTKHVGKEVTIGNLTGEAYTEAFIESTPEWDAVTAKMSLAVALKGDGKGTTKLGGTLRMKRDQVIQLSVTYLLGIEVGRAEISPDGMTVIDRINKRYVHASFDELKRLANADLDFHTLQSLFLNRLFLPGRQHLTARDAAAFAVRPEGTEVAWMEVKNARRFRYSFRTDVRDRLLRESRIALSDTGYGLSWQYDDFRPLDGKPFPSSMQVRFEGGKTPVTATFDFSRLSVSDNWEKQTTLSSKYEKMELQDLLKLLFK